MFFKKHIANTGICRV